MNIKLAEALLRRKELQAKVDQLHKIRHEDLIYQVRGKRVKVTDSIDNFDADCPKLEVNQVTAEYDFYATALRKIDALIQQANWTTELEVEERTMSAWVSPKKD